MVSIIIAAHNEEAVIARCLDALQRQQDVGAFEVVVSANGCTDKTAAEATRPGVTVIDRPEPGKASALNAAETVARSFPRVYLDADIVVPPGGLAAILAAFERTPTPLAAIPARRVDTSGRPWPVRSYFAINTRLPAFDKGLFGRGMIALSEGGRARFAEFPTLIADDLFLDSQFGEDEKAVVDGFRITVESPFTTADLLRRLVRVRRGNSEMRAAAGAGQVNGSPRAADRSAWLRVVMRSPRLIPAALPYLGLTVVAELLSRRPAKPGAGWGRDESTRGNRPDPGSARP